MTIEDKVDRHRRFLERADTDRPLLGLIPGWESFSRYVPDTEAFFPKGPVSIDDLTWDRFLLFVDAWRRHAAARDSG